MHDKTYYVYIISNWRGNVLYTGITSDLMRRIWEHKNSPSDSYAWRYNINRLVYYQAFTDVSVAIKEEKRIKAGSRKGKVTLISAFNPEWIDLAKDGLTLLRRGFTPPRNDKTGSVIARSEATKQS